MCGWRSFSLSRRIRFVFFCGAAFSWFINANNKQTLPVFHTAQHLGIILFFDMRACVFSLLLLLLYAFSFILFHFEKYSIHYRWLAVSIDLLLLLLCVVFFSFKRFCVVIDGTIHTMWNVCVPFFLSMAHI